jgi:putative transposase
MAIPYRGLTGHDPYFVTASCVDKRPLLQSDRMAQLFVDVLYHYRSQHKYLVHEFAVMPNHFHLLLSPQVTLERAMQFVKGGFSFRARKAFGLQHEIWQTSFYDHRVRDAGEYLRARHYIHHNPVKAGLAEEPEKYPYSSANPRWELDEVPQRLKPQILEVSSSQG